MLVVIISLGCTFCQLFICVYCIRKRGWQNDHTNDCLCSHSHTIRSRTVLVQRARIFSEQRSAGIVYRTGRVSVLEPSNRRNLSFVGVDYVNNPSSSLDHNANTNALSANNNHTNTNASSTNNDNTNTLSTNKDCSNTLNDDAPPPYSSTDDPPSYAEIDL